MLIKYVSAIAGKEGCLSGRLRANGQSGGVALNCGENGDHPGREHIGADLREQARLSGCQTGDKGAGLLVVVLDQRRAERRERRICGCECQTEHLARPARVQLGSHP